MYKLILKPFLFLLSPEKAHHLTVSLLQFTLKLPFLKSFFKNRYEIKHPKLEREVLGLQFKNPVGLAAGFDKDGKYFEAMSHLGFGFIEIGTVTPLAQDGNAKPRLFRLPQDNALINRMGFNNEGIENFVSRLKKSTPQVIIGGNIGKNKVTSNENAAADYTICFEALFPYVDYFVVNVSSPNTPNLRALQEKRPLTKLLQTIQSLNQAKKNPKPVLLKIAPDLNFEQLDDILEIIDSVKLAGIIATNTTISRKNLNTNHTNLDKIGNGGLSGQPLRQRSTEIIRYINEKTNGTLTIIGVGGINTPKDALDKINAGASLVQIYTGLIYEGPSLIRRINEAIIKKII